MASLNLFFKRALGGRISISHELLQSRGECAVVCASPREHVARPSYRRIDTTPTAVNFPQSKIFFHVRNARKIHTGAQSIALNLYHVMMSCIDGCSIDRQQAGILSAVLLSTKGVHLN